MWNSKPMSAGLKTVLFFNNFYQNSLTLKEKDNPELVRPNKINKEYKIEQNDFTQNSTMYWPKTLKKAKKEQFSPAF